MHALWHHFTETRIVSEGEEPEVDVSIFTNTLTFLKSRHSITIYGTRAFQRAAPRPLIHHYVKKAGLLVSLARNPAMFDIRSGHSSHEY